MTSCGVPPSPPAEAAPGGSDGNCLLGHCSLLPFVSGASAHMYQSCMRSAHRVSVSRFFFKKQTRAWDSAVSRGALGFFLPL